MRVLQLGVGAVGEVNARVVAQEPDVSAVVLADIDETRVSEVAARLPAGKAERLVLDVTDRPALMRVLKDVDFCLNALVPRFDLDVMNACLATGTHYLDMASGGPREVCGSADVDEQLALDGAFKRRHLAALISFGIDPGASDVFARALHDQFDTVESIRILDGDNGAIAGFDLACSFSPETMVEECLLPPAVFLDGKITRNEPLTEWVEFDFPAPVGRLRAWNVDHEEAQLMAAYLTGKGLRQADFYIALSDDFVEMLRVVKRLDLQSRVPVKVGGVDVTPLDFIVSRLPRPVDLAGRMSGHVCVGALATGTIAGEKVRRYMHQITSHEDAWDTYGVNGTSFQTGAAAACAVNLFARGEISRRGVFPPEVLDPTRFVAEMERVGLPVAVVDIAPGDEDR